MDDSGNFVICFSCREGGWNSLHYKTKFGEYLEREGLEKISAITAGTNNWDTLPDLTSVDLFVYVVKHKPEAEESIKILGLNPEIPIFYLEDLQREYQAKIGDYKEIRENIFKFLSNQKNNR